MGIINLKSVLLLAIFNATAVLGFVLPTAPTRLTTFRLYAELPSIDKMKASEMRKELESYGISTKSLFEKSEFVAGLKKARAEGKTPIDNGSKSSPPPPKAGDTTSSESVNGDASDASGPSRDERYKEAFEKAKTMKVGELKKELTDRGISTKSFFEKSEFVKAYAEAIADNKSGGGGGGGRRARPEEPRDPSYRDVVMQKMGPGRDMGQRVIDVVVR